MHQRFRLTIPILSFPSLLLSGMAERGYLPELLRERSEQGTPTYSILLCLLMIVFLQVASFETLVEFMNFNYSISLLLEFAAFIRLRIAYPNSKSIAIT